MAERRRAPSSAQVILAIARREIRLAARRKLVRLLFLGSVLPPVVLTVVLVVRIIAEQTTGFELNWHPLLGFLKFQALPVALLALGLGTPSVARDRSEEVLFLYATRPVLPWHYALGKLLAVAVPAGALMLAPGILIAIFRLGVTADIGTGEALSMVLKLAVASAALAWGYAGVCVGPSAAVRKARWALLIALGLFVLPDVPAQLIAGSHAYPFTPGNAINELLQTLFGGDPDLTRGSFGLFILLAYGFAGMLVTTARVQREMIP
jgi:ABC-type transport system involved in multi-copper enzyme maturation permease subunit